MVSQSFLDCSEAAGLVSSMSEHAVSLGIMQEGTVGPGRTVHAEVVEGSRDLDLGFDIEVGIGELLALAEGALCG
jgi:hypothetical protein